MGLVAGRNLNQDITYWAPGTRNSFNELTFIAPVVLKGRWKEKAEQVRSPKGDVLTTRALIHVDRPVEESGWLAQGDQTAFTDPTLTGLSVHECAEIIDYQSCPDLRNLETSYKAYV